MPPRKARGGGRQPGPSRTTIGNRSKQRKTRQSAAVLRAVGVAEEEVAPEERPTMHKKRKLEQPASLEQHVRFFALSQHRCTGAYDDAQPRPKRRRAEPEKKHGGDRMEQPAQMPSHGCGPPPASAMTRLPRALQPQQQQHDPVTSMGLLGKLPTETRDAIFRHVLVLAGDVRVLQGWSLAFPRTRPRLPGVALLQTCEVLRRQGARLLYGENRFVHLVRDPPAAGAATTRRVLRGVYGYGCGGSSDNRGLPVVGGLNIPIDRYGHLIRHVAIVVEANRMADREHRDNFLRSIAKLGPGGGLPFPANLHTVTIQVPALAGKDLRGGYGYCHHYHGGDGDRVGDDGRGGDVDMDRVVPICSFFDARAISALRRLSTKFIRILATDRCDRLLESVIDLRYYSTKQRHARNSNGNANGESHNGEEDPATRDQVLMAAREERAGRAIARLQTLSYNLQLLALYPQKAMRKRDMWAVVERDKPVFEYIELGNDFRDSVELETPAPPPRPIGGRREKRGQQQQLTEQWLEETEAAAGAGNGNGIGEGFSSSSHQPQQQFLYKDAAFPTPPVDDLEARLNLLKAATYDSGSNTQAPPEVTNTAAATSARKGKAKISTRVAPKKSTTTTRKLPEKRHQQQQAKKNSKATRPPTEAQELARERNIDRINKQAAPSVAIMRAERIAKEEKAAREAAVAAAAAARATGEHGEKSGGRERDARATAPTCSASSS